MIVIFIGNREDKLRLGSCWDERFSRLAGVRSAWYRLILGRLLALWILPALCAAVRRLVLPWQPVREAMQMPGDFDSGTERTARPVSRGYVRHS